MNARQRALSLLLVSALLMALLPCAALADGFSADPDRVERTSLSVLKLEVWDAQSNSICTASGVVLFSNKTLVTNYHVIEDAATIFAYNDLGDMYMIMDVLVADKHADLAILRFVSPTDMQPLLLNADGALKRIQPVVAIGSLLGVVNSITTGNISAVYTEDGVKYVQFSAPISKGSSGGALLDDDGRVIGITSGFYTNGQNMNLAVHASEIVRLYGTWDGKTLHDLEGYASSEPVVPTVRPRPTAKQTATPKPTVKKTATPKPTVKKTATPKPTATPKKAALEITSIAANQNGKVVVNWKAPGGRAPYTVKYVRRKTGNFSTDFNAQGFYWESSSTYLNGMTIGHMAPGSVYWVMVEDANGNRSEKKTVTLPKSNFKDFQNTPQIRNFELKQQVSGKVSDAGSLTARKIKSAGAKTEYGCYFEFHYPQLKATRHYYIQFTLTAPDGWCMVLDASDAELPQGNYYYYYRFFSLDYAFECLMEARGGSVPTGRYTITMYWNGKYVDDISFTIS